jgi:hypothetical protein
MIHQMSLTAEFIVWSERVDASDLPFVIRGIHLKIGIEWLAK